MRNKPLPLAAVVVLLALPAACGSSDDPVAAYQDYLSALAQGDVDRAFALLATASRDRLAALEGIWRSGGGHPLLPDQPPPSATREPGRALFGILIGGGEVPEVAPLPKRPESFVGSAAQDGERAWVRVATPLGEQEAQLIRDDGAWRVLLKLE